MVFQSLFSWMTLIGLFTDQFMYMCQDVSILVFLDDAHRPHAQRLVPSLTRGFNPCFLG